MNNDMLRRLARFKKDADERPGELMKVELGGIQGKEPPSGKQFPQGVGPAHITNAKWYAIVKANYAEPLGFTEAMLDGIEPADYA